MMTCKSKYFTYYYRACKYNLERWFILTFANFYTSQALFILMFFLTPRLKLSVFTFIYFVFLPCMMLYNLFGSYAYSHADKEITTESTQKSCVSYITLNYVIIQIYDGWFGTFLILYVIVTFIELLVFTVLMFGLKNRMSLFIKALRGSDLRTKRIHSCALALDFALQSLFNNVSTLHYLASVVRPIEHKEKVKKLLSQIDLAYYQAQIQDEPSTENEAQQIPLLTANQDEISDD